MADPKKDTPAATPSASPTTGLPAPLAAPVLKSGQKTLELATNRLIYKPDTCKDYGIQGVILAMLEMPPVGGEREWDALVIRATQPSVGIDRDGTMKAVQPGDQVLLPTVYSLEHDPVIAKLANNLEWCGEFFFKPKSKVSIGGGKQMWNYQASLIGDPMRRNEEQKLYVQLPAQSIAGQLGAGNGASASPPPPF